MCMSFKEVGGEAKARKLIIGPVTNGCGLCTAVLPRRCRSLCHPACIATRSAGHARAAASASKACAPHLSLLAVPPRWWYCCSNACFPAAHAFAALFSARMRLHSALWAVQSTFWHRVLRGRAESGRDEQSTQCRASWYPAYKGGPICACLPACKISKNGCQGNAA